MSFFKNIALTLAIEEVYERVVFAKDILNVRGT